MEAAFLQEHELRAYICVEIDEGVAHRIEVRNLSCEVEDHLAATELLGELFPVTQIEMTDFEFVVKAAQVRRIRALAGR